MEWKPDSSVAVFYLDDTNQLCLLDPVLETVDFYQLQMQTDYSLSSSLSPAASRAVCYVKSSSIFICEDISIPNGPIRMFPGLPKLRLDKRPSWIDDEHFSYISEHNELYIVDVPTGSSKILSQIMPLVNSAVYADRLKEVIWTTSLNNNGHGLHARTVVLPETP